MSFIKEKIIKWLDLNRLIQKEADRILREDIRWSSALDYKFSLTLGQLISDDSEYKTSFDRRLRSVTLDLLEDYIKDINKVSKISVNDYVKSEEFIDHLVAKLNNKQLKG